MRNCTLQEVRHFPVSENNLLYSYWKENCAMHVFQHRVLHMLGTICCLLGKSNDPEDFMPWLWEEDGTGKRMKKSAPKVDEHGNLPNFGLVDVED